MAKRKPVNIKDIARLSGASLTTVSLALNRRAARIPESTRRRVLKVAEQLGYRPSRVAQALQSQRAGMIAVLVPPLRHAFADVYFGELISAIHDTISQGGYKLLLEVASPQFIADRTHLDLFDRRFVDGMLCLGVTNRDKYLDDFSGNARPMVVLNNYMRDSELNFVRCDYEQAGYLAATHLLELGHRNIGLIHGAVEVETSWDHRRGLTSALNKAGIRLPAGRMADGCFNEEAGGAAALQIVRDDPAVTALVAGNDKMAIGAISALRAAGYQLPRDISVIGCDDIHQGAYCEPALTTIHTPLYELGQRACHCLMQLIAGDVDRVQEVHPVRLTQRKSTAEARP